MTFNTDDIFKISTDAQFSTLALKIFEYQHSTNLIYREYVNNLGIDPTSVKTISEIPFLPIEFFKSRKIVCTQEKPVTTFYSSGTTQNQSSKHYIIDINIYETSFLNAFRRYFGNERETIILGLLPSYLEKGGSSLVYMVNKLIENSNNSDSGFFLHNFDDLQNIIVKNQSKNIVLFGVSYALLDFAASLNQPLPHISIIETGGMKGRRKEITKQEMYAELKKAFGVNRIYSEYGMTEMLSQAYSTEEEIFTTPPWLKIMIRELNDPFSYEPTGKSGGINVIDLANIYSCSFIETKDLGVKPNEATFKVLGRIDNSDTRGCNLMVE